MRLSRQNLDLSHTAAHACTRHTAKIQAARCATKTSNLVRRRRAQGCDNGRPPGRGSSTKFVGVAARKIRSDSRAGIALPLNLPRALVSGFSGVRHTAKPRLARARVQKLGRRTHPKGEKGRRRPNLGWMQRGDLQRREAVVRPSSTSTFPPIVTASRGKAVVAPMQQFSS